MDYAFASYIASYAALTQVIAQEADMVPKTFIHTFGDSHFYTSIGKRTQWYRSNFKEVQQRIRNVSQREDYLEVIEWINKNAPADGNEEKYDHVTAILEQMSREPRSMPRLRIAKKPFDQLTVKNSDFGCFTRSPVQVGQDIFQLANLP